MAKMISILLQQEEAILAVLGLNRDTSHLLPTWQDIHVWESLAAALLLQEDIANFLSGDTHVTVSSVIPMLYSLTDKMLYKHPWCKKARPSRKHQLLLFSAGD